MNSKKCFKNCSRILSVIIIAAFIGLTGCSKESNEKMPVTQTQKQPVKSDTTELSIVRDKNVNVDSLDQNKDGYLYQCDMDYNVISDKPGTCPNCGMELKRVSVAEAKNNLAAYYDNN
jgi:hypothetical protein